MKAVSAEPPVELAAMPGAALSPSEARHASLRRLLRLRWGLVAAGVLFVIVAVTLAAPWLAPHDPLAVNIRHRLGPPAWMEGGERAHLLGTDPVGRDLLSRMIYGGRVSLLVGVSAVILSATIGVLLGLGAGYFGGRIDWVIMTGVNVMLTFPFVLLALAVIAVLGPSLTNMIAVLGAAGWPIYARVIRAETLALREREFVVAGRALGMGHLRLIFRQILPNLVSAIVVIATLQVAQVIVLESFLSFLGPRRTAADAGVGQHARRGAGLHAELVVDRDVSGPGDLRHHPRHQPPRQRASRLARPAHEALIRSAIRRPP